jgi:ligand-binding sensor domain-containing protein
MIFKPKKSIFKKIFLIKLIVLINNFRISFLVCSLAFFFTSHAQEPIYKHFGVDEGLPSSEIYDIYQDKDGYIWFATDKGLSRYNGYEFENFDINDGLPGNVVLKFYPQENGQVWCYTYHEKALFYFDERNFKGFTVYEYNNLLSIQLKLSTSVIKSVFIDKSNTVHLGGVYINGEITIDSKGVIKNNYANNNYLSEENIHKKSTVLNSDSIFFYTTTDQTIIDKSFSKLNYNNTNIQAIWLDVNKKAVFMDEFSLEIVDSRKEFKTIKNKHQLLVIKAINSYQFLAGYHYDGARIINDKGVIIREYLKGKSVTNFLIDHEGGYWFTTLNSGVYYIQNPSIAIFKPSDTNVFSQINSLVKQNNELLIGYKNGDFATIGHKRNFTLKSATKLAVPSVVEYDDFLKKTYVYSNYTIKVNNKVIANKYIVKLSEPSPKGAVFATDSRGFFDVNQLKNYNFTKRIQDVCIWKKDTLLATSFGVFKKDNNKMISLSIKSKLLGYRADDIDLSKKGDCVFVATQSAGVVVYGKEIFNITTKDGLASNIVNEIYVENEATIWACTNKGLSRVVFNKNNFTVTNIDKNSGLLSNEVEDVEIINDTLWVGTIEGLCYLPKKVLDDNQKSENIYFKIKEVKVNDVFYNLTKSPELNYNQNSITFLVQGISFAKNDDLKYQYRLKEIDKKWTTTKSRSITFPNLKQGNYTFEVRAWVGNTTYSKEQLAYKFKIKPPFWKSDWFYVLCFLAFSGIIYLFFKIQVLTYNKDVTREFIRLLIKWLKRDEKYLKIRTNGETIKIATDEILYVNSSGNYLDIVCVSKTYTIRCKIGNFMATTPDALEYLRVHRSYIIRIDKVSGKSKNSITIKEHTIPVGETYLSQLDKIQF